MKKIFFFIPVIFLIFATTITKNSTKQLDKKIFETNENIRVLKDKYELEMLEYNYLSSPKKLIEYQKKYFDNELLEADIANINWIEIKKKIEIKELLINYEWRKRKKNNFRSI